MPVYRPRFSKQRRLCGRKKRAPGRTSQASVHGIQVCNPDDIERDLFVVFLPLGRCPGVFKLFVRVTAFRNGLRAHSFVCVFGFDSTTDDSEWN